MFHPALRHASPAPALPTAGKRQLQQLRAWALACLLGLAFLQVLMPTLGLMHRVVHHHASSATFDARPLQADLAHLPVQADIAEQADAITEQADAITEQGDSHSLAQRLFDGHASTDCQLLDHLLLGVGVLPVLLALLAPAPVMRALWSVQALLLRKSAALFQARAPPFEPGV